MGNGARGEERGEEGSNDDFWDKQYMKSTNGVKGIRSATFQPAFIPEEKSAQAGEFGLMIVRVILTVRSGSIRYPGFGFALGLGCAVGCSRLLVRAPSLLFSATGLRRA